MNVAPEKTARSWKILIVDDEKDVHLATLLCLRATSLFGRPLSFLHAYSAAEARGIVAQDPDIAVAILDVVMESDEAGLELIDYIRNDLNQQRIQIVLRTGQPGQCPELSVITRYGVASYIEKAQITKTKLISVVSSALRFHLLLSKSMFARSFGVEILENNRRYSGTTQLAEYALSCLNQMARLLRVAPEGMIVARIPSAKDAYVVHVATGMYSKFLGKTIPQVDDVLLRQRIHGALEAKTHIYEAEYTSLYFSGQRMYAGIFLLPPAFHVEDVDPFLIKSATENIISTTETIDLVQTLTRGHLIDSQLSIPNRHAISNEITRRWELKKNFSVLLLQIDEFDAGNELFGDHDGDKILRAVSERLHTAFPLNFMIGRISGARFAIVGRRVGVEESAIRQVFKAPILVDEVVRPLSLTYGVAHTPSDTQLDVDDIRLGEDMLRHANLALKKAKMEAGSYVTYDSSLGSLHRERASLSRNLRQAMKSDELTLHYQPQIDLVTRRVCGVEALTRWRLADGTFCSPDKFIPVAESNGLINELGQRVLMEALRAGKILRDNNFLGIRMAVNASTGQFKQPSFIDDVAKALQETETEPRWLELEVTESIAVLGVDLFIKQLTQFRDMGIELAIDDFGTGYSSLSYLSSLPVHRLKIDKSFVKSIAQEQPGKRIAEIVIGLARRMGMKVLAEGIETKDQAEILTAGNCDEGQGYFYSRPLPLDQLLVWLKTRDVSVVG